MKTELLRLLLVFLCIARYGQAQDTVALKFDDALFAAIKNNKEVQLARLDQENALAKFNQTNSVFLPQVNVNYAAVFSNNPLNVFGFKLQQQSVSPEDFNPQLLNSPASAQNYMARFELQQPLLNLDMLFQRKAAAHQVEVYNHKTQRTRQQISFEMHRAYGQLQLAHQATAVLSEALRTANAIFESSRNRYEKGYLQRSDLLLVQVQVAAIESKLASAKSNVSNASDYLSLLMGVKCRPLYSVESLEKTSVPHVIDSLVPINRPDLEAMRFALKAQDGVIHSIKISYVPRLNLFSNYTFNDKTALGFGSGSYLIGAQLSWNVFSGTARHFQTTEQKLTHAKLEQQLRYQLEQSQLELDKTIRQLHDNEFALRQHEHAVTQASEAMRILQNRFHQGLVSTKDVLQAQSTLSEQRLLLSEVIYSYNTTIGYLQFLTSISDN